MNSPPIFTVDQTGRLNAMRPSAPRNEAFMQELVAQYPDLITDRDGALLLIRREQPIADQSDGGGRWSVDHLFVTQSGVPVLVELKRAADTRIRREVVGQMLDYAANCTAYWRAGVIAQSFAASVRKSGDDPDEILAEFLGDQVEPDAFWEQVDTNFSAGRIKMVFVADEIPSELARIIEFLNEQMRADVRGVELKWFEGSDGVTALAPRVIGETERAHSAKRERSDLPFISRDDWIEEKLAAASAEARKGAYRFVDCVAEAGGHAEVTRLQGSLIAVFDIENGPLYPAQLASGSVKLCLKYLRSRPAFANDAARQALVDRLEELAGPLLSSSINGFPGFPVERLNDERVFKGLAALLQEIARAAAQPA